MEPTIIKCPKCGQETMVQNVDVSYSEAEKILSLPLDENGNPIVSETELDQMLTGSTSAKCYWCEADLDLSREPQEREHKETSADAPADAPAEPQLVKDDRLECYHCHTLMVPKKGCCPKCYRKVEHPNPSAEDLTINILQIMNKKRGVFGSFFGLNRVNLNLLLNVYSLPCDQEKLIGISEILVQAAQEYPECSKELLEKRKAASDLHTQLYGVDLL